MAMSAIIEYIGKPHQHPRLCRHVLTTPLPNTIINGVGIDYSTNTMALHSYPVQIQWFSDGLPVVAVAPEYQESLGSCAVRIGSKRPEQMEAAVAPYIAREVGGPIRRLHPASPATSQKPDCHCVRFRSTSADVGPCFVRCGQWNRSLPHGGGG